MSLHFRDVSDSEYLVIVNAPELYRRARELKYQNAILMDGDNLDGADIKWLKEANIIPLFLLYLPYGSDADEHLYEQLDNAGIKCIVQNLAVEWDLYGDNKIESMEDAVKYFPRKYYVERELEAQGAIKHSDYQTKCGNCGELLNEFDKYCQYCGAKRGEGVFIPGERVIEILYGPPIKYRLRCSNCDHVWEDVAIGYNRSRYCPGCGKMMIEVDEKIDLWSGKILNAIFEEYGERGEDNED